MTKIDIAKYAAKLTVGAVASEVIERVLACTTNVDPDGIPVRVTSAVGGYYVSNQLEPYSSAVVEKAAEKLNDFRSRNAATA